MRFMMMNGVYRRDLSASLREKGMVLLSSSRNCRTHGSISMYVGVSKTNKLSSEKRRSIPMLPKKLVLGERFELLFKSKW